MKRRNTYVLWFISLFVFIQEAYTQELDSLLPTPTRLELVSIMSDLNALNRIHDIEVRDGIAYLAGKGGSLAVVDVKFPAKPQLLWYVNNPVEYEDAETVMLLGQDRLLVGTRDMLLFDIAEPAQPLLLARLQNEGSINHINGFARRSNKVFGTNKNGYIFAVKISNLDTLSLIRERETRISGELDSPHDIGFSGDLLVVVSPEGFGSKPGRLVVYRVFDPSSGKLLPSSQWEIVGKIEHPKLAGANRIKIQGNLAAVASSVILANIPPNENLRNNVAIVDLTNPAKPRLRDSINFPSRDHGPHGLEFVGNTVFAAGGLVQAIDVSDPDNLQQRAVLSLSAPFAASNDLVLVGNYLFCTSPYSLVVIRVVP